jgi:signal peptidase II
MKVPGKIIRFCILFLVVTANVGCDRITKNMARTKLLHGEEITMMQNHITLIKVENTGAFLSLGNSLQSASRILFLILLPSLILLGSVIYILVNPGINSMMNVGLSCIIGGGIGNLTDRIIYGSVTDFLHIKLGILETGIFNMADVSIMVGIFLLFLKYLKR